MHKLLDGWTREMASPEFRKNFLRCFAIVGFLILLGAVDSAFAQQAGPIFTGNPAAPLNSGRTILIIARYICGVGGVVLFIYGIFTFNSGGWKTAAIGLVLLTYEGWQALGVLIGKGEAPPIPGLNF
jgi:hypothetical protein